jgi:RNA polymerase sigma-54 factor
VNGRKCAWHVSKDYQDMMQTYKVSTDKSGAQKTLYSLLSKLDSAKWFIDAIRQRQETLFVTIDAIMHYQEEYFLDGDETS